jgi:hypothetical protein
MFDFKGQSVPEIIVRLGIYDSFSSVHYLTNREKILKSSFASLFRIDKLLSRSFEFERSTRFSEIYLLSFEPGRYPRELRNDLRF